MLAAICVAAGNVYGYDTAARIFVGTLAFLVISVVVTTASITVTPEFLHAGRAALPVEFIGPITLLDREQTERARSRDAHPDAFYTIRSWIPQSVIVVVTDESDPHPYWHISSRNPKALRDALESVVLN